MLNLSRVTGFTNYLVNYYDPRHHDYHKAFVDRKCTLGGTYYSNSNLIRSSNYVKQYLEGLGYSITKEYIEDGSGGYNTIAERIGNVYPNVFIEIGAHIDTKNTTPGASDNAAGVAGVMELATVLKNYANRYSLRFITFIGEEYGRTGSKYHTQQIVDRNEKVKTGLVFDGIGWSEDAPDHMNCIWANSKPESQRIANIFDTIRTEYGIDINWRLCSPDPLPQVSDNVSYWEHNLTSVLSIGGLPYEDPNYHACTDDMIAVDMGNAFKTIQQNLVVALLLDAEPCPLPSCKNSLTLNRCPGQAKVTNQVRSMRERIFRNDLERRWISHFHWLIFLPIQSKQDC